ncbi:hypothetical protein EGI11_11255 [Chryseobacterium sp. H3056]|uniref:Uncharacterized protein n=1 Tax=Kaistella daneshvariae TaxID=2487074 RepID=A0A3N0WTY6_9FLAO|nr:hypothetical protein EGI11_11255 [Kaistella daneshvariae]
MARKNPRNPQNLRAIFYKQKFSAIPAFFSILAFRNSRAFVAIPTRGIQLYHRKISRFKRSFFTFFEKMLQQN